MNRLALLLLPLSLAACDGTYNASCLGSSCIAVGTIASGSGTLDIVDLSKRMVRAGVDTTLDAHTAMRVFGPELFVLQRDTGSVRIYDPATFQVTAELPLSASGDTTYPADKSSPRDLWVDSNDGRIFVTLAGNDAAHSLAVLDRSTPGKIVYIGLPQDPSDTDGKPEPDQIYYCYSKIYVTLTGASGRIAIIDYSANTVRGIIPLIGQNPSNFTAMNDDYCTDIVVAEPGGASGNLERIDLDRGVSKGVLSTDGALGGRPMLVARASDDLLYVALGVDSTAAKVVAYDPQTRMLLNDVSGPLSNVSFLRVFDGKVFFGAGDAAPGLYVGPADGTMVTTAPIGLSLAPSSIGLPD